MIFLIAADSSWTPQALGGLIGAGIVGLGVLMTIITLAARGYWVKKVQPMLREEVKAYEALPEIKKEFEAAVENVIKEYLRDHRDSNTPGLLNLSLIKVQVKEVIDNELKRTDGLIFQELSRRTEGIQKEMKEKLDEIQEFLDRDVSLKETLIRKLSRLEGVVTGPHRALSDSELPVTKPPFPVKK